jgi:hypothetical protein
MKPKVLTLESSSFRPDVDRQNKNLDRSGALKDGSIRSRFAQ